MWGGGGEVERAGLFKQIVVTGHRGEGKGEGGRVEFWNVSGGVCSRFWGVNVKPSPSFSPSLVSTSSSFASSSSSPLSEAFGEGEGEGETKSTTNTTNTANLQEIKHFVLCPYSRFLAVAFEGSPLVSFFHPSTSSAPPFPPHLINLEEGGEKMGPTDTVLNGESEEEETGEEEKVVEEERGFEVEGGYFKCILEVKMKGVVNFVKISSAFCLAIIGDVLVCCCFLLLFLFVALLLL